MPKENNVVIMDVGAENNKSKFNLTDTIRMPDRFKELNHLISRDLNNRLDEPTFRRYKKEDILKYLKSPYYYENYLRDACVSVYESSPHFRRLIQYFVMLSDLAFVVSPYGNDITRLQKRTVQNNYNKVLRCMEAFQVKSQFPKIITVCLREDVYYGTLWIQQDNITIQRLPSDYCRIASVEGNVFNVSFNMQYFDTHPHRLQYYPPEFTLKYDAYQKNKSHPWVELDSPTSFAIKCTNDIESYALPPFAGLLPEIYDLENYKAMKLTKTELENYAILVMKLGMTSDGQWQMDFDKA